MTIRHGMKLAEIEAKMDEVQKKRRKAMDAFKAGEMTLQDMRARLKGLQLSLEELELQRKKAKR